MAEKKKVFTAKTIEEAKAMAAEEFGAEESRISFTVLEEPKKGLFGIVKGDAKVEAVYNVPTSKADVAGEYIKEILKNMGIDDQISITEEEDGAVIEILGDTTGAVIGRRGETLDAIQYLASMAANRIDKEYYRISVDCCGYREKRKTILEELAVKIAKTVLRTGRTSTLEPMNPYERRIIHSAIADIEGVTSRSVGDEPYRKVIIAPTNPRPRREGKGGYNRGEGGYRDGGYRGGNRHRRDKKPEEYTQRRMDMMKTSFEKDYKRPKPEDSTLVDGDLYGKIDI
ncbi:MAG: protein jag [Oscillospiraceae bacterium]|nr:protein jag [Oscillospiraceae bacterium]